MEAACTERLVSDRPLLADCRERLAAAPPLSEAQPLKLLGATWARDLQLAATLAGVESIDRRNFSFCLEMAGGGLP